MTKRTAKKTEPREEKPIDTKHREANETYFSFKKSSISNSNCVHLFYIISMGPDTTARQIIIHFIFVAQCQFHSFERISIGFSFFFNLINQQTNYKFHYHPNKKRPAKIPMFKINCERGESFSACGRHYALLCIILQMVISESIGQTHSDDALKAHIKKVKPSVNFLRLFLFRCCCCFVSLVSRCSNCNQRAHMQNGNDIRVLYQFFCCFIGRVGRIRCNYIHCTFLYIFLNFCSPLVLSRIVTRNMLFGIRSSQIAR